MQPYLTVGVTMGLAISALSSDIRGKACDKTSKNGRSGVTVILKTPQGESLETITTADGTFQFRNVPRGKHQLGYNLRGSTIIQPSDSLTVDDMDKEALPVCVFSNDVDQAAIEGAVQMRAEASGDPKAQFHADIQSLIAQNIVSASVGQKMVIAFGNGPQKREFPDISIDELKQAIAAKKVIVIDVNGNDSYKTGHIPTAINFIDAKTDLHLKLPADKHALVVAYSGGPTDIAYKVAAEEARRLGYSNVKHLSAGISGWKSQGAPTESNK